MISSFGNKVTADLYHGISNRRVHRLPPLILDAALRKLDVINSALQLDDLRSPPGNRLEALKGDFAGFYSIRINSQWRVVFRWLGGGAEDVQVVDYHR